MSRRSSPSPPPSANIEGFTLLEVLVAAAVLSILMVVLLTTMTTSLSLWRNTENKMISDREARSSQLLLAQDLSSVVVPGLTNTNLWPRLVTNRGPRGGPDIIYLKMLTSWPQSYQTAANDVGDVCYVEYYVAPATNTNYPGARELKRLFWGSRKTYDEVLKSNAFPTTSPTSPDFQSLGLYLLQTNTAAVRGLSLASETNANIAFLMLGTNLLPMTGSYSATNRPAAIEVNFAVADPDTLANSNLLANPDIVLRNAGLYSTRFYLPPPR